MIKTKIALILACILAVILILFFRAEIKQTVLKKTLSYTGQVISKRISPKFEEGFSLKDFVRLSNNQHKSEKSYEVLIDSPNGQHWVNVGSEQNYKKIMRGDIVKAEGGGLYD